MEAPKSDHVGSVEASHGVRIDHFVCSRHRIDVAAKRLQKSRALMNIPSSITSTSGTHIDHTSVPLTLGRVVDDKSDAQEYVAPVLGMVAITTKNPDNPFGAYSDILMSTPPVPDARKRNVN